MYFCSRHCARFNVFDVYFRFQPDNQCNVYISYDGLALRK